jgi:hypothetical protein
LTPLYDTDAVGAGAVVQLLDPKTMDVTYHVTTDGNGVAMFNNVLEGQYYLTIDPRSGTNIKPVHFPIRISPTHGGTANNPILNVNSYSLLFTTSANSATLRVGAYEAEGWTIVDGLPVAPSAYKYVPGLIVYASPVLNSGTNSAYYGMGSALLYPTESTLPFFNDAAQTKGIYSAEVKSYGVAAINIPWTTDPNASQYWKVWCRTQDPTTGKVTVHTLTTTTSGSWDPQATRPEGAYGSEGLSYSSIVQFSQLGENAIAVNDPTMPDPF